MKALFNQMLQVVSNVFFVPRIQPQSPICLGLKKGHCCRYIVLIYFYRHITTVKDLKDTQVKTSNNNNIHTPHLGADVQIWLDEHKDTTSVPLRKLAIQNYRSSIGSMLEMILAHQYEEYLFY